MDPAVYHSCKMSKVWKGTDTHESLAASIFRKLPQGIYRVKLKQWDIVSLWNYKMMDWKQT